MANPAIVAGLLAGYTVGAVVTAFAVAHDDTPLAPSASPALRPSTRAPGVCARAADRGRGVTRCLRALDGALVSSPRR